MTNSYLVELFEQHNEVCMRLQENLPTEEREHTELKFEELTKEIQSYCL
tara:strand:- start:1226 stop:1372 length:147 start_codon:yes stop_codon:yes gene_type:complete